MYTPYQLVNTSSDTPYQPISSTLYRLGHPPSQEILPLVRILGVFSTFHLQRQPHPTHYCAGGMGVLPQICTLNNFSFFLLQTLNALLTPCQRHY